MNLNPFRRTQSEKVRDSIINIIKDKKKRQHFLSVLSVIFLFFAIFIGIFIGLVQNQEIRKQASGSVKKAEIILVPSSTPLRAETLSTVFVRLNTHGEAVDGLQVVFDLLTDTTDDVSVRIKPGTGLRWAWDRVQGIEGGKKISFAAITSDPYKPFSSNQPIDIAEITFVAEKTGNLAMVFDGFATKANRHQQLKNVLKPIIIQEYQIASAPTPIPTPRVAVSARPTISPANIGSKNNEANLDQANDLSSKGEEKVATDSVTAAITISSNTNTSSLGGSYDKVATVVDRACNDVCQSSVECGTGFLCYENQCRLSTNLANVKCEDIAQRSKSCNETCNQAIECKTGLTCFEGSCRDIKNPQSEVCQNDQTVLDNIDRNCGQECAVNQDCGDSLSCFAGSCRLATNPESPSCSQKEVVIKKLGGSNQEVDIKQPAIIADEESSLSLLTQVVIALALTIAIGMLGSVVYSFIRKRNNSGEL